MTAGIYRSKKKINIECGVAFLTVQKGGTIVWLPFVFWKVYNDSATGESLLLPQISLPSSGSAYVVRQGVC